MKTLVSAKAGRWKESRKEFIEGVGKFANPGFI